MEQVPNTFPSLFWGYTVLWAILAVYILFIGMKLRSLERRMRGGGSEDES